MFIIPTYKAIIMYTNTVYVVYLMVILSCQLDESHKDYQINHVCHYRAIYTASMGFFPQNTDFRQFIILSVSLFEKSPNS